MNLGDLVHQFNVLFPKVSKHTKKEKRGGIKRVVSLYGGLDGNISLYLGNFVTQKDIEEMRKKVIVYTS